MNPYDTPVCSGATFVDPTAWACPTDPCPVVIGRYLVFRAQHHLATPFVTALPRDRRASRGARRAPMGID